MTDETLSNSQRILLQRWFDGELGADEQREAQRLRDTSPAARQYLKSLEEIRGVTRTAFETADVLENAPEAEYVAHHAHSAPSLRDEPLEEIVELLQRVHDGEATAPEARAVRALRSERDDIDAYLEQLDQIGDVVRTAAREARESVDFRHMQDELEATLEARPKRAADIAPYDPVSDEPLLHRYADDEASPEERARVEVWLARGTPDVEATLRALGVLESGARSAFDEIGEEVDFEAWQSELHQSLEERDVSNAEEADIHPFERPDDVSSGGSGQDSRDARSNAGDSHVSLLWHHRRKAAGAVAALLLAVTAATFGGYLWYSATPEGAGSGESVVIVDDISYHSGTSVRVEGPSNTSSSIRTAQRDDSNATVIWLQEDGPQTPTSPDSRPDASAP